MKESILSGMVLALLVSFAQPVDARGAIRAGGNLTIGLPVGEFGENVDRIASGLSGYAVFGLGEMPLGVGGSFGFLTQGSERIGRMQIGPYVGDMVTRNKVLTVHGLVRFQGAGDGFAPYADLLVGFRRFYTTTEIRIGFDVPDIDMDADEWVLSYGVGGGLSYRVYESVGNGESDSGGHSLCVDGGVRYLLGSEADEIVDIDSVTVIDGRIGFNTISSRTEMVTIHVGISFLF